MPQPVRQYSDLNLNMLVHPVRQDILKLTNEDAVKRSVTNLILTNNYERFYQPDLGSGIAHLLFEPMNMITERLVKNEIERTISSYEPRAELLEVVVVADEDNNGYRATITFTVRNMKSPTELTVFLERVR